MSIEAAIRKVRKRIAVLEKRSKIASVFKSFDGEFPEDHVGLVIVFPIPDPNTPDTP